MAQIGTRRRGRSPTSRRTRTYAPTGSLTTTTNCKEDKATNCNKSAWAVSQVRCKQGRASELERQVRGNHVNANVRKAGGDGLEAVWRPEVLSIEIIPRWAASQSAAKTRRREEL